VRRTEDKESGVELAVVDAGQRGGEVVTAAESEVRLLLQVRRPMDAAEGEHGRAA
jgi:GTPase involved in cell partitioning and DNA repair